MSKANKFLERVSLKNNDDAVSPVVGTILMVAVTVILAAVIAAFIFGFTGAMPVAPNVAYFTVERNAANGVVTLTNVAPTIAQVSNIQIFVGASEDALTSAECVATHSTLSDLTTTYGFIEIAPGVLADPDAVPPVVASGCGYLKTTPTKITIKASVNGAAQQIIETVTI